MIAIYALSNIDCPDDIYIGSSKNIKMRLQAHKYSCNDIGNDKYNLKVYKFIRENGGFENWKYHIIESFDVLPEGRGLMEREDYWMLELKPTLNSQRANHCRSDRNKEYHQKHREKLNTRKKKWNNDNQARLSVKSYCECGGQFTFRHRHEHYKTKRCTKYMDSILSI